MKKKNLFIITILSTVCFWGFATNTAENLSAHEQSNSNKIELRGEVGPPSDLRSGTDPIVVEQQGNVLIVRFQQEVGVLQVSVAGAPGQVYAASVDTAVETVITIPMAGLPAGSFTITFSNERGMMWGNFTL